MDFATGKAVSVPGQFGATLSPSGRRLALNLNNTLQVVDVASGTPEWTAKVTSPVTRLAFGETDGALVYVEGHRLRVAALPAPPLGNTRSEHLHRAPIRALSIDPSGAWAFSADAAGEQRLWEIGP